MQSTPVHTYAQPKTPAEYIATLPAWDKVPRLDTWLPHVMCENPIDAGMYRMEYLAQAGRTLVLGMVARALQPGCKFDYILMLEGAQGIGKSRLIKALASEAFYSNQILEIFDGLPENIWAYEDDELALYDQAAINDFKALACATQDRFRQPYSGKVTLEPRRFVLIGTTNCNSYRQKASDRRFLRIPVRHPLDVQWVKDNRDQLFAEAMNRREEFKNLPNLSDHPGKPTRKNRRGGACK